MKASSPAETAPSDAAADLSADVVRLVTREAGDVVRCTHIYGRFYRCNWWRAVAHASFDNPNVRGSQLGTTFRVHRSAFLELIGDGPAQHVREVSTRPPNPSW